MPAPTDLYRPALGKPAVSRSVNAASPHDDPRRHGYYDVSILKPPVWKWQIAAYCFLGGMSAGAYVLARLAERFGDRQFRYVAKIGTYTACAAALPCPVLLIWDLGDAWRFHHMLRVFKPRSAMNLGTWVLSSITPIAFGAAAREYLTDTGFFRRHPRLNVVAESVGVVADAVGIPLAILLATYTGVLVSNTANPVWCQNKWIAPLFAIGGFSTGISAITLTHNLTRSCDEPITGADRALKHLDTIGHAAELVAYHGYLRSLGPLARPYTRGKQAKNTWLATAGLVAAEVIKHLPVKSCHRRTAERVGSVIGLASAFAVRWALVHAAHESARDPDAARQSSRARDPGLYTRFNLGKPSRPPAVEDVTRRAPQESAVMPLRGENPRPR